MTMTDRGQGRRTDISDYRVQNRGGYGSINYKVNDVKGYVCGIKVVDDTEDRKAAEEEASQAVPVEEPAEEESSEE